MLRYQLFLQSIDAISKRGIVDGLNTSFYSVKKIEKTSLFTRFYVSYQNKTNKISE